MLTIELKGKKMFLLEAVQKFKKLYDGCNIVEKIPEFYYHAPLKANLAIDLVIDSYYVSKEDLDSLNLQGSSIKIINNNYSPAITFIKPASSMEFIVRKQKQEKKEYKPVTTIILPRSISRYDSEEHSSLLEGETLEQYEQRIYG